MKKATLLLFGAFWLSTITVQSEAGIKTFAKNASKTVVYGAATALTTTASLSCYYQATEIPVTSRWFFWRGLAELISEGQLSWDNYQLLNGITKAINASQPVLYGASGAFGAAALYCGAKTVQHFGKTVSGEE